MHTTLNQQAYTSELPPGIIATKEDYTGLATALTIFVAWSASLAVLMPADLTRMPVWLVVGGVLLRSSLHTGLFITAHDAMHRTVFPGNHKINDLVGSVAVGLYALLPYRALLLKHQMHHRFPATEKDPDYHDGQHVGFIEWYFTFLKNYMEPKQLLLISAGMWSVLGVSSGLLGMNPLNLLLFWFLPFVISSFQLFYFGTYLPHKQPSGGYDNRHRAKSIRLSNLWSFLSCYHFGCHWEHHEYPLVPWYRLPLVRKP